MNTRTKLLFIFLFSVNIVFGQNGNASIDSLLTVLPKTGDTTKIKVLLEISKYYYEHGNIPSSKGFCEQAIELSKKEKNVFFLASSFFQMGGVICNGIGDFSTALDYLLKSYNLLENGSHKKLLYRVSNSLGNTYSAQENFMKALEFYNKAFELAFALNDSYGISLTLIGKGNIYLAQKKYKMALESFSKAANGLYKTKHKYVYAIAQLSVANVYFATNESDKALKVYSYAYETMQELDNKYGMGQTLINMGIVYRQKGNYQMALKNYYKSMDIFRHSTAKYNLKEVYQEIAITYNKQNKNDSAFHYMQLYTSIKDSIFSEENLKLITEMQTKYESVKKEEENKSLLIQKELADNKLKQQTRLQIGLSLFVVMIFVFAVFLYRSNLQKQKTNLIISAQKEKVEEQRALLQIKNNDIVDSITYAKRLQEAILPTIKAIKRCLPQSFILYKPKDIVAGDFYWMETVSQTLISASSDSMAVIGRGDRSLSDNRQILIAAADSTGHGVPGAIVSVVCSNALNRTVKEFGISEPGKVLDKVRELVVETFIRNDAHDVKSEVMDGMDISLVSIEFGMGEEVIIKWAGANNPLWLIRKMESTSLKNDISTVPQFAASDLQLIEIKANKQSIGKTDVPMPFTTHSLELNKGDQLYLFTDGYADQFGGEKGKKFKYQQLKEKLLANAHRSMEEQKEILNTTIEDWKGNLEQVDDILIIGISL